MHNTERIESLDLLRGLAALFVCLYHFMGTDAIALSNPITAFVGQHGKLGVQMFFVISGFVIPYSMHRTGYTLKNLPTFIAKREIRLAPPYLVAIIVGIGLWYLSALAPGFAGKAPQITVAQLASHFAYMSELLGHKWVVDVFWTLGIEFQYYVAMALIFPIATADSAWVRRAFMAAILALSFLPARRGVIVSHLPFFALGITTFHLMTGMTTRREHAAIVLAATIAAIYVKGIHGAAFGFATALFIAYARVRAVGPLAWLGTISYSLYLMHLPFGNRVMNLGERYLSGFGGRVTLVIIAIGLSLCAAYVLYKLVERPSQRAASRLSYRKPVLEHEKTRHRAYAS